jgi:hypothetical protein
MMNVKKLFLTLLVYGFVLFIFVTCEKHPECGESPTKKYKDLAKTIG